MEMFMFGMFAGIIFGVIFIGVGSLIDRHNYDTNKNVNNSMENNTQRVSNMYNNNSVYDDRTNSLLDSYVGNVDGKVNNRQNIQSTKCYENGEITNLCAIIALKGIKREMNGMLSDVEKDALDKAIDNTITAEKLNAFINNIDLETIDIDD